MSRNQLLCEAISENRIIDFFYDGHRRVVEPVQLGYATDNGNVILIGYQIGGYSESGALPPWRRFETYKIRNLVIKGERIAVEREKTGLTLQITESLCHSS